MTIKDIARESGYAVATVSRVLNNRPDVSPEARAKVKAVLEAHNFTPNNNARHLKQPSSTSIAIVVKGTLNTMFSHILEFMQTRIEGAGYTASIYYLDEEANELDQAKQICRERKPLGLLFLGGSVNRFRTEFSSISLPSVLVTNSAGSLAFENLSSVSTDDTAGASCAVSYLMDRGHTRIGVLGGNLELSYTSQLRYLGCIQAFSERGIPFQEELQYQAGRFSYQSAYETANQLLDRMTDLTAIFAMSDVIAIGAIRAIRDRGLRVPEDISVIGFDGIDLARYYDPKLTTIRQQQDRLAGRSVEILLDCMEEGAKAVHEIVPFELVEGESVARI
ncbi:MAG: LacI family transcriptional regulator [Oscillospiraceae bacterium]|nr:LacI family transcriptional regulator [Oscillospiraceae bacterium]